MPRDAATTEVRRRRDPLAGQPGRQGAREVDDARRAEQGHERGRHVAVEEDDESQAQRGGEEGGAGAVGEGRAFVMSRTVFILGAGASMEAGAPVMRTFLDVADALRRGGKLPAPRQASFDLVFKGITALSGAHSKAQLDIDNLE